MFGNRWGVLLGFGFRRVVAAFLEVPLRPQRPELIDGGQALAQAMQGVDERDQFASAQDDRVRVLVGVERARERGGAVVREEEFERRPEAGDLQLAPEAALVAADAVHDARDVAEVVLELVLEELRRPVPCQAVSLGRRSSSSPSLSASGTVPTYLCLFAAKHARLVESARAAIRDLDQGLQSIPSSELAGRVLQRLYQLRSRASERTEEHDVGEVHVLESLGMLSDAGDEAI